MKIIKPGLVFIGSLALHYLGGWDLLINTLLLLMLIDYVLGLSIAGIFKKSSKTQSGGLSSGVGWKGIAKKVATLLLVIVSYQVDLMLGLDLVRNATIIFFTINELISIVEHAGTMGIPIPPALLKAIDLLNDKHEELQPIKEKEG